MSVSRKTFLLQLAGGGWLLATAGCGGGGGYDGNNNNGGGNPQPAAGGCSASISDNHGHALSIPAADLDATVDKTYDIAGSADHTHSVTFTAAQLAQLKAGQMVTVTTTTTLAHDHRITESCT